MFFTDESKNKKYTTPKRELTSESLLGKWSTNECIQITFHLNNNKEEVCITKAEYIDPKNKIMNKTVPALLSLLSLSQIILTPLSVSNVYAQVAACETNNTAPNAPNTTLAPTNHNDCLSNYQSPITAQINILVSSLTYIVLIVPEYFRRTRVCEQQMSQTLKTLVQTYSGNNGKLPQAISTLLQTFSVDGVLADSLTVAPQMENIERSLFKVRQDLNEYAVALQSHIALLQQDDITKKDYAELLQQVKDIQDRISPLKIGELYTDDGKFGKALDDLGDIKIKEAGIHRKETEDKSKVSGLYFRPKKALESSANYLSGILKFNAIRTKPKL